MEVALNGIFVDPHSAIPTYAQLKDQVKFACAYQELKLGDVLPSIRALAHQLNVGDGAVRRAYRELREAGLLTSEHRKHVVVLPALVTASETVLMKTSVERCDRLIGWARDKRLSAISLGRLLLRRALARETASPSYVFVDVCKLAAEESVAKVSKAWGIKVGGVPVADFAGFWNDKGRRLSAVLASQYVYEDVMETVGEATRRVFLVKMRVDERLQRRIGQLPARSALVYVGSEEDTPRAGEAILQHYEHVAGRKRRLDMRKVSEIHDLTSFVLAQPYRLFLFSPLVWEKLPARIQRMAKVAPVVSEPDLRSLEETRIAAGVLL